MKLLITTACLFFSILYTNENNLNQVIRPWNAVLNGRQIKVPIYKDNRKSKVSYIIMNDTIKETYFDLQILVKSNNLFKVKTICTLPNSKVREGWIDLRFVGIYFRSRKLSDYPIYTYPNKKSKFNTIVYLSNSMVSVIDIAGSWLKVKFSVKNKTVTGWVPAEYLCADSYASCT